MNQKANEQASSTPESMSKAALRYNKGKSQLSYLLDFPNAIGKFAEVAQFGSKKYARYNWKGGHPVSNLMDSLLRHAVQFQNGEDVDEESGCLHAAHMLWNCMALIETLAAHPELDDRYKPIALPSIQTLFEQVNAECSTAPAPRTDEFPPMPPESYPTYEPKEPPSPSEELPPMLPPEGWKAEPDDDIPF